MTQECLDALKAELEKSKKREADAWREYSSAKANYEAQKNLKAEMDNRNSVWIKAVSELHAIDATVKNNEATVSQ